MPSIAQLVERWTVVGLLAVIHRSLVQIRLEGLTFFHYFFLAEMPHITLNYNCIASGPVIFDLDLAEVNKTEVI